MHAEVGTSDTASGKRRTEITGSTLRRRPSPSGSSKPMMRVRTDHRPTTAGRRRLRPRPRPRWSQSLVSVANDNRNRPSLHLATEARAARGVRHAACGMRRATRGVRTPPRSLTCLSPLTRPRRPAWWRNRDRSARRRRLRAGAQTPSAAHRDLGRAHEGWTVATVSDQRARG